MKKYLILVEHSMPEIVKSLPAREWKLSDTGKEQAKRLVDRLCDYQSEVIISSVEPKAMETAEVVAEKLRLPVYMLEGLHEHDRSNTPFLSKDEFQKAVQEFFDRPTELVFGTETANQACERFSEVVQSILNRYYGKTIILISHGTVISLFVSRLMGIDGYLFWDELGLPSYVVLDVQSNKLIEKKNVS